MSGIAATTQPEKLTKAHVVPFAVFMCFMLVLQFAGSFLERKHSIAPWWQQEPAQLIYPIQTLVTLGFLIRYWKFFSFRWSWKWSAVGVVFGVVGIGFWLLPTTLYDAWHLTGKQEGWLKWLGVAGRNDGFDPGMFENRSAYWASLSFRFFRASVVVALVEEIFWRGFLMRFVCDWEGNFWKQPFGQPRWISYLVVTTLFVLAHASTDRASAVIYGSMTYLLCIWSKSLGACVVMHASANFLMCVYIITYGKYGLW